MAQDLPESVEHLSKEERVHLCAKEVISVMPSKRLEEPLSFDSEEVTRDKVMAQVKFETGIYQVQRKFGEEMLKEVLDSAKMGFQLKGLSGTPELEELQEKLRILEGEAPQAPPQKVSTTSARGATGATGPTTSKPSEVTEDTHAFPTTAICVASLFAASLAVAGGLLLWQRRQLKWGSEANEKDDSHSPNRGPLAN